MCSGFNTDYGSSEPLKTLVMLCYVRRTPVAVVGILEGRGAFVLVGVTTKGSRQNVQRQNVHGQKVHDIRFTTKGSRQNVHDIRFTTKGSRQKVHGRKVHKDIIEIEFFDENIIQ